MAAISANAVEAPNRRSEALNDHRLQPVVVEYELGVTARTVKIPKIDGDYFDEEAT